MRRTAHRAHHWHVHVFALFLSGAACDSGAETEAAESPSAVVSETDAAAEAAMSTAASPEAPPSTAPVAGAPAKPDKPASEATPSTRPQAGSGGSAGSSAAASGAMAGTAGEAEPTVPCEVSKALANACHRCHGAVPANGAPMSLVDMQDFQALSVGGKPRIPKYQQALMRMNGSKSPLMPPATSPITEADKKTLIDWFSSGAPAASGDAASCI